MIMGEHVIAMALNPAPTGIDTHEFTTHDVVVSIDLTVIQDLEGGVPRPVGVSYPLVVGDVTSVLGLLGPPFTLPGKFRFRRRFSWTPVDRHNLIVSLPCEFAG